VQPHPAPPFQYKTQAISQWILTKQLIHHSASLESFNCFFNMQISITASMLLIAFAFASPALAAPVYSNTTSVPIEPMSARESRVHLPATTSDHLTAGGYTVHDTRDRNSMLTRLPVVGEVFGLLNSVTKGAPMNDQQKEVLAELRDELTKVVGPVLPRDLPAVVPAPLPVSGKHNGPSSDSVLAGLPAASFPDSIGLSGPTKLANNAPLSEDQKATLVDLAAKIAAAVGKLAPNASVALPITPPKREFANGFGALFDEESGTLEPENVYGYLKRRSGLDPIPDSLPVLNTSLPDSIGLGDPTSKLPLSSVQKDVLAKPQDAISKVAGKVIPSLPI
jgi:hypothetical protein